VLRGVASAHQRLAAQHAVAPGVAEAETREEAAPRILQAICECLDWDIGMLWIVDRALDRIRCAETWIAPAVSAPEFVAVSRALVAEVGRSLPGHAWRLRQPVWIDDLAKGGPVFIRGEVAAREGLHGAIAFPIVLGQEVLAVMDFLTHEVRRPDQDVLQMLTTFGSQIGQFIQRKRAQEGLREKEQELQVRLAEAEDGERRRLARDLHDSVGQALSALKMELARLDDARLAPSVQLVNQVIAQTRTLIFDLYPPMLDDLGLVPTLESYVEQWSRRHGVRASVSERGDRRPLHRTVRDYVFRATKELLANVAKHARATEVLVAIHWQAATLRIAVDDDGAGFDADRVLAPQHRRGLGLFDIKERVRHLGGRLLVDAHAGVGSQIVVELPVGPIARTPAGPEATVDG
jgi:signal transduction histidine kinase